MPRRHRRQRRTITCWPLCISRWQRPNCCRQSIWWTWATRAAKCWSIVSSGMALPSSVPLSITRAGRPTPKVGLPRPSSSRLGSPGGHLSGRQTEHFMAAEHLSQERHAIRGALRTTGLRGLPDAQPLHAVQGRATHHHASGARSLRSADLGSATSGDGGISEELCRTCRDRRHAWASDPSMRLAQMPLYRCGKGAFATHHHSRRRQRRQNCRVAQRYANSHHPPFAFCSSTGGGLTARRQNSPPVSTLTLVANSPLRRPREAKRGLCGPKTPLSSRWDLVGTLSERR